MVKNKKQAPIKVRSETAQQIRFISAKSGLSMTQVLSEVFDSLFNVACTFDSLNFDYETCVTDSTLLITVSGKNKLRSGSFEIPSTTSNKKVDQMIKKKLSLK